jgi:asparagine synthase (glutamine-hydrolysing)
MCGFAGMIDLGHQTTNENLRIIVSRMIGTLRHRGPDDGGAWTDAAAGIALGHRRLAVIDLTSSGRQPMVSASGRYVVVYNGEIYNYRELRSELESAATEGLAFRGSSDTEVMLAALEKWGVPSALSRFNGMFSFALWDRRDRKLFLVRDRLGEKPLYYGWLGRVFVFGSELKALQAHPLFACDINREALALYLRYNCVPTPHSIFSGVQKLVAGTFQVIDGSSGQVEAESYWSLEKVVERGMKADWKRPQAETANQLETLLKDAVKTRMVSDVPLGVFLSGGIDSSTITALMQEQSCRPVRTFSIGLHEPGGNEAKYAAAVARHLGTDHTELYVTVRDAQQVIPLLPTIYDEPFADSSQIPTFLVSRLARQQVTVALSGDGGDEILGGYNRHVCSSRVQKIVDWLPLSIRRALASKINRVTEENWDSLFRVVQAAMGDRTPRMAGYKMHRLASILPSIDLESAYLALISHWTNPQAVVIGCEQLASPPTATRHNLPFFERMMLADTLGYLPDDVLTKLDRASMAVSLEARVPFLDHRVVEFAWAIPAWMKIREGQGKWILRQVLKRYVPSRLIERAKCGFGIPLDTWLRGPLRDWAEGLLDETRIRSDGFFDHQPILQKWREFVLGRGSWQYHVWDVLMFQAWLSAQRPSQANLASFAAVSN